MSIPDEHNNPIGDQTPLLRVSNTLMGYNRNTIRQSNKKQGQTRTANENKMPDPISKTVSFRVIR